MARVCRRWCAHSYHFRFRCRFCCMHGLLGRSINHQGIVALMALGMLKQHAATIRDGSEADRLHVQIEALRLAFADGRRYVTDLELGKVPVEKMLDEVGERRGRGYILSPLTLSL